IRQAFDLYVQICQGADSGVPAEADSFKKDIDFAHAVLLLGGVARLFCRYLGSVSRTFLGATESAGARARVSQSAAPGVGKRDDGVVGCSQNMHVPGRHTAFCLTSLRDSSLLSVVCL